MYWQRQISVYNAIEVDVIFNNPSSNNEQQYNHSMIF